MPSAPKSGTDPSSRERLLAAALDEFASHGLAGARTEEISQRAGVNKQLINYYFGGKHGLYTETLRWCFGQADRPEVDGRESVGKLLAQFFKDLLQDTRFTRLQQWEALDGDLSDDAGRRGRFAQMVDYVKEKQREHELPEGFDPDLLFLSLLAIVEYPVAYPQLTQLVTGQDVADPKFLRRFSRHLHRLADLLSTDH